MGERLARNLQTALDEKPCHTLRSRGVGEQNWLSLLISNGHPSSPRRSHARLGPSPPPDAGAQAGRPIPVVDAPRPGPSLPLRSMSRPGPPPLPSGMARSAPTPPAPDFTGLGPPPSTRSFTCTDFSSPPSGKAALSDSLPAYGGVSMGSFSPASAECQPGPTTPLVGLANFEPTSSAMDSALSGPPPSSRGSLGTGQAFTMDQPLTLNTLEVSGGAALGPTTPVADLVSTGSPSPLRSPARSGPSKQHLNVFNRL